jgi:hypothetical protein
MMLIPEQNLTPPYSVIIAEALSFPYQTKDVYRQVNVKETRAIDPDPPSSRFDNEIIIGLNENLQSEKGSSHSSGLRQTGTQFLTLKTTQKIEPSAQCTAPSKFGLGPVGVIGRNLPQPTPLSIR